mmetsp:Transcript_30068/g.28734  ORF Transcript_30068/g.28734 Transcript_30068/m.28734 type:complete len:686 (-) Transcript_30068:247-2304(-)
MCRRMITYTLHILFLSFILNVCSSRIVRIQRCQLSMMSTPIASDMPMKSSGVTFSGSSGAAIEIKDLRLSIGNNDIMNDVTWSILPKERWALVGRNGAGKSTLLRAITGTGDELVSISNGDIVIAKKARMGYLEQKGVSGSVSTVRQEVSSRMDRLTAATKALDTAEAAVAGGDTSDTMLIELEEASVEFEAAGGYTVEQKISNVLKGLGFIEEDYDRFCAEFSGGWQMRIALARLLLSEPDLLLLDEPTNHLDKGARDWLGNYLSKYDGTLLVVSHDENLLQAAVSSIAEVRSGGVELYKSRSHDQWIFERDERVRTAQVAYDANQKEIARLQAFVDRFGAKTMGASMAQSRLKTIEKLETEGVKAPKVGDGPLPFLKLPPPPRGSQQLLELTGCTLAWPPKAIGDNEIDDSPAPSILKDCNLSITRGMRIVVRGPNGAGKSTLLSALSGKLIPMEGTRTEGDGLELGVFTQDLAQDLDQEDMATNVVCKMVRGKDPTISDERARSALGALGLIGEKAIRKVGHLSGGEKARVALASFVLIPHNLLLLDEPSNHLDLATLKVLTAALRKFEGSVVVISHDRRFLEELEPTHVVTVRGGKVNCEERTLRESDWNDPIDSREEGTQKYATKAANKAAVAVITSGEIDTVVAGKKAAVVPEGAAPKGSNQKQKREAAKAKKDAAKGL